MLQSLNGTWIMSDGITSITAELPGSVYSALMAAKKIDDPHFRLNQYIYQSISEKDYTFFREFVPNAGIVKAKKIIMRFNGIDTIAEISLNGNVIGTTDNMHRIYEFDVTEFISKSTNNISVKISSPINYINEKNKVQPLWGVSSTMQGYPHIRKAHYMFGWDWGPQLPDMGIWRSVELIGVDAARIESVNVRQEHKNNSVKLKFEVNAADTFEKNLRAEINIVSPDGKKIKLDARVDDKKAVADCDISSPSLWNVRGYGRANLYMVTVVLFSYDVPTDSSEFNIGLRKIEVCRDKDSHGESFCFKVNGIKIFAMGANYIPEDNFIGRLSPDRTRTLLKSCAAANFNMIRVWGGGFYPDECFYDTCDRLGLLVWQDLMFACSVYDGSDVNFCANVRYELVDNIKRMRNHACIALICGNNEIESAWQYWGLPDNPLLKNGYQRMFELLAPKVVEQFSPDIFYWPSSPSSGGGFNNSGANDRGDSHYWDVWHGLKPFTEYNKYLFRFCSEYGFESIPCMKTVASFAEPSDMNLMGAVMQAHQKCDAGNEKLLYYIAQMVHYPYSFTDLIYASQLVQADAVRLNVEHMRRNRGICMGSLYWQLNDCCPVISWSSVDYFGRWKALHYYAKRFYAPLLCSVDGTDKNALEINVSNEKLISFKGSIRWRIRKNNNEITASGEKDVIVPELSAKNCLTLTPEMTHIDESRYNSSVLEYELVQNGAVISESTYMYCLPKQFDFLEPQFKINVDMIGDIYRIRISADNFAKGVYLDFADFDCIFSDNWFDLHGNEKSVLVNKSALPPTSTMRTIASDIKIKSYYDICRSVQ